MKADVTKNDIIRWFGLESHKVLIQLRNLRYGTDGKLTIKQNIAHELLKLNGMPFEGKQIVIELYEERKQTKIANNTRGKKNTLCKYYLKGLCRFGDKCRYVHEKSETRRKQMNHSEEKIPKCKFYERGRCKFNEKCRYIHNDGMTNNNQHTTKSEMMDFLGKGLQEGFAILQSQLTSMLMQPVHQHFLPAHTQMMNFPPHHG